MATDKSDIQTQNNTLNMYGLTMKQQGCSLIQTIDKGLSRDCTDKTN